MVLTRNAPQTEQPRFLAPATTAAAAYEAGYADQSHMTRAFRRFGGFTPANMVEVTLVTLRG